MTARTVPEPTMARDDLPPRQQEIMLCLARGSSNQEIADDLGLQLSTVRNCIADVYEKLGLSNRVQALLWVLSFDDLVDEILVADQPPCSGACSLHSRVLKLGMQLKVGAGLVPIAGRLDIDLEIDLGDDDDCDDGSLGLGLKKSGANDR